MSVLSRYEFNRAQFLIDLITVVRKRGASWAQLSRDTGVLHASLTRLRHEGQTPGTCNFLALCRWAQLDPFAYLVETDGEAYNRQS